MMTFKYLYSKGCAYLILRKDYKDYISHNIPISRNKRNLIGQIKILNN